MNGRKMAIKDFRFLRNDRGLKDKAPLSKTTYKDIYAPVHQKINKDERKLGNDYEYVETNGNDLVELTDTAAILNALVTIFSTRKGMRPLVPELGLDLRQYIGEPITEDTKYIIDEDIRMEIEKYEPRVKLVDLNIESIEDDNALKITMKCVFPNLPGSIKNIFVTLKGNGDVFTGYI